MLSIALAVVACGDAASPTAAPTASPTNTVESTVTDTPVAPTVTAGTTASATATSPAELTVERVQFELGPESSPFLELLSRVPATDDTRGMVRINNIGGTHQIVGIELPEPPVDEDKFIEHYEGLNQAIEDAGLSTLAPLPFVPNWPEEMRRYLNTWNPYPHAHISPFMAEQSIFAGTAPYQYELALGQDFSAAATAAALNACDCDQPDVNDHGGMSYYSWGEEGQGTVTRRFDPPLYDHVGRGPRLLVGDGFAYYTIFNDPMEGMIDATQDAIDSLADIEEYAQAVRILDGMGTMGVITMFERNLAIGEVMSDFSGETDTEENAGGQTVLVERTAETTSQALTSTPLLLPFSMAAGGIGYDGERPFTGFVLAQHDEAAAEQNVTRLEARLLNGAFDGRRVDGEYKDTPFSDLIARAELHQAGRFVVAKIYMLDPDQRVFNAFAARSWFTSSISKYQLIIHE